MTIETPFKIVRPLEMRLEVGQFVIDGESAPLPLEGEGGLHALIGQLSALFPHRECDAQGNVTRVFDDRHAVAAEAPGLLRFAFGPTKDVGEIRVELETFQRELSRMLEAAGLRSVVVGSLAPEGEQAAPHAATNVGIERADGILPDSACALAEAAAPLLALLGDNTPAPADAGHIVHARTLDEANRAIEFDGSRLTLHVADALPAPFATAFATLAKGLLATDESLETAQNILGKPCQADIAQAWEAIGYGGFEATIYGKSAHELADALIECACTTLATNEHNYLVPLRHLVRTRKTLTMMGRTQR